MKKYITQAIKNQIDDLGNKFALNWIAEKEHSGIDTPESRKQVEASKLNMEKALNRIEFYKKLLKTQSKEE